MEYVEYSEWVPLGALAKTLFALIFSIVIVVTFAVLFFAQELLAEDIYGIAFSWGILAFLMFVFWNYRGLRIQITSEKLSVEYGLFNKKSFLLSKIKSCTVTRSFGRYLGVGVRYGFDDSVAYTTSFGSAIEVVPKVGRTFVFSSGNPRKVCEIIGRRLSA
jgi:hypothetical protein